jgi:lysophospholipase L1-like esterase
MMCGVPSPRKVAATALVGSTAALTGFYGTVLAEAVMARKVIGVTDDRPPSPDGLYGDDLPGEPVRVLVAGDSAAVGYGTDRADQTPPGLIGIGLSHVLDCPVDVRSVAVVGAQTSDLPGQLEVGLEHKPDVVVIIVGANDVTHRVRPRVSARRLGAVVRDLTSRDIEVVVGTCPDLGLVRPLQQPLRWYAHQVSAHLAKRQTVAVARNGGRSVSLGELLGRLFLEHHDTMFGADRFHPSARGYANMAAVLLPAITGALREHETGRVPFFDVPRDLMPLGAAAAQASHEAGTEVVAAGRWATVRRRRG